MRDAKGRAHGPFEWRVEFVVVSRSRDLVKVGDPQFHAEHHARLDALLDDGAFCFERHVSVLERGKPYIKGIFSFSCGIICVFLPVTVLGQVDAE